GAEGNAVIIEKIFEQAREDAEKIAIYDGGRAIRYGEFASWIAYAHGFLRAQELRAGSTVVLNADRQLDAWILGIAARRLGHATVAVQSFERLEKLWLRDIGCVITTVKSTRREIGVTGSSYKLVELPIDQSHLPPWNGAVPCLPEAGPQEGGHMLLTSGTTGATKKVLIAAESDERWIARGSFYGMTETSVVNVANLGLWTSMGY